MKQEIKFSIQVILLSIFGAFMAVFATIGIMTFVFLLSK